MPRLSTIGDKLREVSSFNELFDSNFEFETVLGIMPMILVVSAVLLSIPPLGQALQLAWLLQ